MRLLRDKTIKEIADKSFDLGLETGYRLAFKIAKRGKTIPQFEATNSILNSPLSTNILRDLDEIGRAL